MSSTSDPVLDAFAMAEDLPGWGEAFRSIPLEMKAAVASQYAEHICYPAPQNLFRSLSLVGAPQKVRVVILGQDPYHGDGQADGLAFSVPPDEKPPPSLRNIIKEVAATAGVQSKHEHGDLSHWAEQGVLLLNDVLSVKQGEPRSHAHLGWQALTSACLGLLRHRPVVFLLWGKHAASHGPALGRMHCEHLILEAPHPSPLSAHRGFLGCGHFAKANAWLTLRKEAPIRW